MRSGPGAPRTDVPAILERLPKGDYRAALRVALNQLQLRPKERRVLLAAVARVDPALGAQLDAAESTARMALTDQRQSIRDLGRTLLLLCGRD